MSTAMWAALPPLAISLVGLVTFLIPYRRRARNEDTDTVHAALREMSDALVDQVRLTGETRDREEETRRREETNRGEIVKLREELRTVQTLLRSLRVAVQVWAEATANQIRELGGRPEPLPDRLRDFIEGTDDEPV